MSLFRWFKSLWGAPVAQAVSESGLTRRGFLSGLSAVMAASFIAPGLPPVPESLRPFVIAATDFLDAQFDLIAQVQRRAVEEIMAAEDARFLAHIEAMLANS